MHEITLSASSYDRRRRLAIKDVERLRKEYTDQQPKATGSAAMGGATGAAAMGAAATGGAASSLSGGKAARRAGRRSEGRIGVRRWKKPRQGRRRTNGRRR